MQFEAQEEDSLLAELNTFIKTQLIRIETIDLCLLAAQPPIQSASLAILNVSTLFVMLVRKRHPRKFSKTLVAELVRRYK